MKWFKTIRIWLRPEEAIALIFLVPFVWMVPYSGFVLRLHYLTSTSYFVPALLIGMVVWLAQRSTQKAWRVVRDFLPFVVTVWMYENMHDVTAILHMRDKHQWLIAADEWLFCGVNPVVWTQRWVHPQLTNWMVAAYSTYYFYPPVLTMILYRRGQMREFRDAILAIVLTFYIGFIGYVAVPALAPWITMRERFSVDLQASPLANEAYNLYTISHLEVARDCFPSLHTAISLVALAFAWRYWRVFFWVVLPCVLALMVSTIYLRLHYVADVLAAMPLAIFSVWAAPRLNRWWICSAPPAPASRLGQEPPAAPAA